jgi:hypothetical protein
MALLGTASEVALGALSRDEFHSLDVAINVLQRHNEPTACVHAQPERRNLLAGQIGMAVQSGTRTGPNPSGAESGLVCPD